MVHGLRPAAFGLFHVCAARLIAAVVRKVVTRAGDRIVTRSLARVVVDG